MPIETLSAHTDGAVSPIAPGTSTFGLSATGIATTACDGTGTAAVDGGLVGRILGPNGEIWQAESDGHRATFRTDRFGPGLHGIESGIGGATGLRWEGTTHFGTGWTLYMVLDLSTRDLREGRLLSATDNTTSDDFASFNGFAIKLFPPVATRFESRLAFNADTSLPDTNLPLGKVTVAYRVGPRTTDRHVGTQVSDGSWTSATVPTAPTRMQYGYWIDRDHVEPTRSILGRLDVYDTRHPWGEVQARLAWYRQIYDTA